MPNGGLNRDTLHNKIISALSGKVAWNSYIQQRPLLLNIEHPLPQNLRVYIYTITETSESRPPDEYNIQVITPSIERGESGSLDHSDQRFVLLAGYYPELDVFVLWDAYLHPELSFSETLQVKYGTMVEAAESGFGVQERHLKTGDEAVIAVKRDQLKRGILRRIRLSENPLPSGASSADQTDSELDRQRAVDYESPDRRETNSTRIIRNTKITSQLKEEYDYQCQVCGEQRKQGPDTAYAEGHHIKPLKNDGPDAISNLIVLCPNHHADFDYGMIKLDPDTLEITHAYEDIDRRLTLLPGHQLEAEFIEYNNESVAGF